MGPFWLRPVSRNSRCVRCKRTGRERRRELPRKVPLLQQRGERCHSSTSRTRAGCTSPSVIASRGWETYRRFRRQPPLIKGFQSKCRGIRQLLIAGVHPVHLRTPRQDARNRNPEQAAVFLTKSVQRETQELSADVGHAETVEVWEGVVNCSMLTRCLMRHRRAQFQSPDACHPSGRPASWHDMIPSGLPQLKGGSSGQRTEVSHRQPV
jgi:hypothetical protein